MQRKFLSCAVVLAAGISLGTSAWAGDGELTLIHTGDFHGHLVPRTNLRSDTVGKPEGGLARVATAVKKIRTENKNTLHLHTGDTIQGSAEVLYTRGQAIVDVVNLFKPDAFAPGNWEFVYGTERFLELFAGPAPRAPWNSIAANVYYTADKYPGKAGQRVLPPYLIKEVGGVKVGLLGLTTDRGPQVVGSGVTKGFRFLKNQRKPNEAQSELDREVVAMIDELRKVHKVDLLVMLSEMGLANNVRLAETYPGIDVVLSSDMHEETAKAVVVTNKINGAKTILAEEGQDGTMLGSLRIEVKNKAVKTWKWIPVRVDSSIAEDPAVKAKVEEVRRGFIAGPGFTPHVNPFNGSKLKRPIDTVVGHTKVGLHRSNFARESMPGVIEGSSHDFLTDAFKSVTGADVGAIRGFRYGTHVAPGPITMEDLYHFMPIGPQIAVGTIKGQALKNQIENAADGSLNADVAQWTGGWLFNFSGVTMDFNAYAAKGFRATSIEVNGAPLDPQAAYTYASYWYAGDPCLINVVPVPNCTATDGAPSNITVLKDADGSPLDGTEVVVKYLESLSGKTANPALNRIRILKPLPAANFGNPEVQPLRGVAVRTKP